MKTCGGQACMQHAKLMPSLCSVLYFETFVAFLLHLQYAVGARESLSSFSNAREFVLMFQARDRIRPHLHRKKEIESFFHNHYKRLGAFGIFKNSVAAVVCVNM
jgi:hypothetical protein